MGYARVKCLCWKEVYEIEVEISEGLPGLFIIGMEEHETIVSREIIRAAIKMQDFYFPKAHITVNIRLIDDPLDNLSTDIPDTAPLLPDRKVASVIAIAILSASGQMRDLKKYEYLSAYELTLDGRMIPPPNANNEKETTLRDFIESLSNI